MKLLIAIASALVIAGSAQAQQPMPMPGKDMPGKDMGPGMDMGMDKKMVIPHAAETPSTADYKAVMMQMMMSMPKLTGDPDIDFMNQMRPHHQAAIDMAKIVIANGKDGETKKLAQDIIAAQEKEIAAIDAWLKKKGS
jgi:uncharacterized protein (DUF305 family)